MIWTAIPGNALNLLRIFFIFLFFCPSQLFCKWCAGLSYVLSIPSITNTQWRHTSIFICCPIYIYIYICLAISIYKEPPQKMSEWARPAHAKAKAIVTDGRDENNSSLHVINFFFFLPEKIISGHIQYSLRRTWTKPSIHLNGPATSLSYIIYLHTQK
jgi:hypothetical protein